VKDRIYDGVRGHYRIAIRASLGYKIAFKDWDRFGNRRRNTLVDLNALKDALELNSVEALRTAHGAWIEEALRSDAHRREEAWSQSVAVGSAEFVLRTQAALGLRGRNRDTSESDDAYVLRETEENYGPDFRVENRPIRSKNVHFWDVFC
jgi:putative transposase